LDGLFQFGARDVVVINVSKKAIWTRLPQVGLWKLSDGNRFNITERVGTAICQAAKFPERLA
jgi:hypothetical protein